MYAIIAHDFPLETEEGPPGRGSQAGAAIFSRYVFFKINCILHIFFNPLCSDFMRDRAAVQFCVQDSLKQALNPKKREGKARISFS